MKIQPGPPILTFDHGEKMSSSIKNLKWLNEPQDKDYAAALSYLSLLYSEYVAGDKISEFKRCNKIVEFRAVDILRASQLPLLDASNFHVQKNRRKFKNGSSLSPILLLRDGNGKVIVADGYYRICAAYSIDEDAMIPCIIV